MHHNADHFKPTGNGSLTSNEPIMRPVIAIIDDYENFIPSLDAFLSLRASLPDSDIRVIGHQPLARAHWEELRDVEYLVLIRERTRVTREFLQAMPALKALVQTGTVGTPETSHIDLAACVERGVDIIEGRVSDGYCAAELTWALILAQARQLPDYVQSMRRGQWQVREPSGRMPRSVRGQTLGILGFGRIGQLVCRYALAFEMRPLVWGAGNSRVAARALGIPFAQSRDALFIESDVLTLQLRLNGDTRHSVTARDLGLMKPTALLVNTARPGLIVPGALAAALSRGRPARAAVDVHEVEPVLQGSVLIEDAVCLATPHIGYVEKGSYEILFGGAFDALVQWLRI